MLGSYGAWMELDQLVINEYPDLRHPSLVAAFAGWPDAAEVATGAVVYLVRKLNARKSAETKAGELRQYVHKLEAQYKREGAVSEELFEDVERIVKEVEDFLRNERHGGRRYK